MISIAAKSCLAAELPASDAWLSELERGVLGGMRFEKRRRDYRLGRRAARTAFDAAARCAAPARRVPAVAVRAAEDGAPELVTPSGDALDWEVSISHSAGLGVAAVARRPSEGRLRLGCDVERVEPRSEELVRQFFTAAEQARVNAAELGRQALLANLIWSTKESALKALRSGLRADTRGVEVTFDDPGRSGAWGRLAATVGAERFSGYWTLLGPDHAWVFTLLSDRATAPPIGLLD